MYVERNVFNLQFGKAGEAIQMWKAYLQQVQERNQKIHARLLTDVSGRGYTLILELLYDTFAEAEPDQCRLTHDPEWKAFYHKFIPLCEKTERTYYKLHLEF